MSIGENPPTVVPLSEDLLERMVLAVENVRERLRRATTALEDAGVPKSAADLKNFQRTLLGLQITPAGFADDPSLYSFLLDADPGSCSLESMVERRLELKPGPRADERAHFTHDLTELLRP